MTVAGNATWASVPKLTQDQNEPSLGSAAQAGPAVGSEHPRDVRDSLHRAVARHSKSPVIRGSLRPAAVALWRNRDTLASVVPIRPKCWRVDVQFRQDPLYVEQPDSAHRPGDQGGAAGWPSEACGTGPPPWARRVGGRSRSQRRRAADPPRLNLRSLRERAQAGPGRSRSPRDCLQPPLSASRPDPTGRSTLALNDLRAERVPEMDPGAPRPECKPGER
jgi:hypothetical protein